MGASGSRARRPDASEAPLPLPVLLRIVSDVGRKAEDVLTSARCASKPTETQQLRARVAEANEALVAGIEELRRLSAEARNRQGDGRKPGELSLDDIDGHSRELTAVLNRVQTKIRTHDAAEYKGATLIAKLERVVATLELGATYVLQGRHQMRYEKSLMDEVVLDKKPGTATSGGDDILDETALNHLATTTASRAEELATKRGGDASRGSELAERARNASDTIAKEFASVEHKRSLGYDEDIDLTPYLRDLTRIVQGADGEVGNIDAKGIKGKRCQDTVERVVTKLESFASRIQDISVLINRAAAGGTPLGRSPSPKIARGAMSGGSAASTPASTPGRQRPNTRNSSDSAAGSSAGTSTDDEGGAHDPRRHGRGAAARRKLSPSDSGSEAALTPRGKPGSAGKKAFKKAAAAAAIVSKRSTYDGGDDDDEEELERMLREKPPARAEKQSSPRSEETSPTPMQQPANSLNPPRVLEDSSSEEEEAAAVPSVRTATPSDSDADDAKPVLGRPTLSATDLIKQARRDMTDGGPAKKSASLKKVATAAAAATSRGKPPKARKASPSQSPATSPRAPPPPPPVERDVQEVASELEAEGRAEESLSWYLRAFNGGAATTCADIGRVLETLGKADEARAWYQKGIGLGKPGGARRCHNALGVSLLSQARSLGSLLAAGEDDHATAPTLSVSDAKFNMEKQARFHFEQSTLATAWDDTASANAEEMCAAAWNNLGFMQEEGLAGFGPVSIDDEASAKTARLAAAERLYNRAADLNHFAGCLNSAYCALSRGDVATASDYYRRAKALRNSGSCGKDDAATQYMHVLDTLFGTDASVHARDDAQWAAALTYAGGTGDARSLRILAERLLSPRAPRDADDKDHSDDDDGVPHARAAHAVRLLHESARLGDADAAYRLGVLAENGDHDVMRDHEAALECYRCAALAGHAEAKAAMMRIGDQMMSSLAGG